MKYLGLSIIVAVLILIPGCTDSDSAGPEKGPLNECAAEESEQAAKERGPEYGDKSGPIAIELTGYISEDGKVALTVEQYLVDDLLPEEVSSFFSGGKEGQAVQGNDRQSNDNGIYFERSEIRLHQDGVYYLALFVTIDEVADGFNKIPHGYNDEQPVLITAEGAAHEKIITQFKYAGPADDYSGSNSLPAGSEGVVVFAYPSAETPAEIHYIYSLEENSLPGTEKGKIIVPINSLTNN